jgi:hypothetical protein
LVPPSSHSISHVDSVGANLWTFDMAETRPAILFQGPELAALSDGSVWVAGHYLIGDDGGGVDLASRSVAPFALPPNDGVFVARVTPEGELAWVVSGGPDEGAAPLDPAIVPTLITSIAASPTSLVAAGAFTGGLRLTTSSDVVTLGDATTSSSFIAVFGP